MKVDALSFSFAGDKYLGRSYDEMDCQKFVEKCMADCGLRMDLAGSNAWYREMTWTGSPEECVRTFGQIPKGALLYILEQDGREPAKYHGDGIGNASHIGIVIERHEGAIHSSKSKGCVCYSVFKGKTIQNGGWNRIGLYDRFSYGKSVDWMLDHIGIGDAPVDQDQGKEEIPLQGIVTAPTGSTVNLRKSKDGPLLERIQIGTTVTVVDYGPEWCKVIAGGLTGWMKTQFINLNEQDIPPDEEPVAPDPVEIEDDDDFISGSREEKYGPGDMVPLQLSYEAAANLYPVLRSLLEQIEKSVGRG